MVYLRSVRIPEKEGAWPFNCPALARTGEIAFPTSVTVFVGENGSGKSTFIESLALALRLPAIGSEDTALDRTLWGTSPLADGMKLTFRKRPKGGFFLRAEDFFGHTKRIDALQNEMRQEILRVRAENAHRSRFAQGQAAMAYASSLASLEEDYGSDPDARSHGESFLHLFGNRIRNDALYILDEPEAPLSPSRQLALMRLIMDCEPRSQFLIATHSPILAAYPNATIYSMDEVPMRQVSYAELENVNLLRDFLNAPERYLHALKREE
ncbi:MAG: AAA family ATPase [Christensenellales bacterium]|jgi:predicted ATPase